MFKAGSGKDQSKGTQVRGQAKRPSSRAQYDLHALIKPTSELSQGILKTEFTFINAGKQAQLKNVSLHVCIDNETSLQSEVIY